MLLWLHLQNLHFSESGMEVISIHENYFCLSSFAEFWMIENFSEPMDGTFKNTQHFQQNIN